MVYEKQLPKLKDLKRLCQGIEGFPMGGLELVRRAEHLGYKKDVTDFIKLFSKEIVFRSQTDFLDHCRLLEQMLKEERAAPPEFTKTP